MGEEVEGLAGGWGVAGGDEGFEIADLGGGITGDVDDGAGGESNELGQEVGVTAFARGIDDDGGVFSGEGEVFKDGGGVADLEGGVGDVVGLGVLLCPLDGGFAEFDTD